MEEELSQYMADGNVSYVRSLWKTVWRFLRNVKIDLPYDAVDLLLNIYPGEIKSRYESVQLNSQELRYGINPTAPQPLT